MRLVKLAALILLIACVPGTSGAPVDVVNALALVEIVADGLGAPRGVAIGPDGAVYVADRDAGTVKRLGVDGTHGIVADTLGRPVGIVFDGSGRLVVAEEHAGRVVRIESDGRRTALLTAVQPRWLAIAADGTLFVSARGFASDGTVTADDESIEPSMIVQVSPSGGASIFADGFDGLQGLAADDHTLYVTALGHGGAAGSGALYATDRAADGSTGGVHVVAALDPASRGMGVAVDALHTVFVATQPIAALPDPSLRALVKATSEGTAAVASRLTAPSGLAFDAHGNLFVADGRRVISLHAPAAPQLGAVPAYTKVSPLNVLVTTEPGAEAIVGTDKQSASAVADATGAATVAIPLTPNAANTLTAWVIGAGGHGLASTPIEASVTHDDIAPTIAVQSPTATYVNTAATVQAQLTDAGSGVASATMTMDGAPLAATVTPVLPASAASVTAAWNAAAAGDGVHTLVVTATDRAGNTIGATRTITVDTTPPSTTIIGGPGAAGPQATTVFTFTGADNLTPPAQLAFSWRLDNGGWTSYVTAATSAVFSGLAPGPHRFEVRARDLAGNEDPRPARRPFTVAAGAGSMRPASNTTFAVSLAPASAPILPGGTTSFGVSLSGATDARDTAHLSVTGLPAGVTALLVPRRVAPGQTAQLVLKAASDAPPSSATFTVAATVGTAAGPGAASATGMLTVLDGHRTALIGRVVDTDRTPLAGIAIILDALTAFTDANGNFLLLDPPAGEQVVLVDGFPASTAGRRYPTIPVTVTIVADRVNELPYLPHLHRQHERFTPIHPTRATMATDPDLPGVKLHLEGDNKVIGWDGRPNDKVSIRTVPIDRLPLRPPPAEVRAKTVYMFYFGKRGGGVAQRPVPFEAPNDLGLEPGAKAQLWYYDESPRKGEAPNDWRVAGTGTVSADGRTIVTDPGVGIPKFCCGGVLWTGLENGGAELPSASAEGDNGIPAADPVDLSTGIFMLRATDLMITGRVPLTLTRTYRSGSTNPGPFGLGTNLVPYETGLQLTSSTVLTYVYGGGARTAFVQQPNGTYTNATVPAFRGAAITPNADGTRTLRFKDGRRITFAPMLSYAAGISSMSDANGNTVTITRDTVTDPVSITDGVGRSFALTWTIYPTSLVRRVQDSIGRTVTYDYDAMLRLVAVTNPAGGVTRYAYDAAGNMTTITDARGITFLTNTYDVNTRVCQQTQADGGVFTMYYVTADIASTPASLELLDEAAAGGPITPAPCSAASSRSPVVATVLVDPRGHPTTYRFSNGLLMGTTDALGHTTTYTRDPLTNLVSSVTDPLNRTTSFTYDANGNVLTVTDPQNNVRTFTYDATFSKVLTATDPLNHTTTFAYDTKGNLTSVKDALNNTTTIAYDGGGLPTSVTNPLNHASTFTYDTAGNLLTTTDALGNTTTRAYDTVSRLIEQTTPLGFTTRLTYDMLNRMTSIRDPKNGLTQFGYDPNGNLLSLTDARSSTTSWTYDAMDRVATRTDPRTRSESFAYDLGGNLASHTDRKGQVATFSYDALNRRTGATYADATVTYAYDGAGRLTEAVDTVGGTITNTYDALDRLTSQAQPYGMVSYTYDTAGRRATLSVSGQAPIGYGYDSANRLTSITQGANVIQFAYDAAGRRTALTWPSGQRTEYGYDTASRLATLTYKLGTSVLGDLQYTYDAAGQRIAVGGSWARTGLPEPLASASYDASNQQVAFGPQSLTYDLNGNLTSDGTNAYAWDARNRLIGITGLAPASFVYDGLGRRRDKTVNAIGTGFLYDGVNPVKELSALGNADILTGPGIDEHLMRTGPDGTMALMTDALGSTLALADGAGIIQGEYTYAPFGQEANGLLDNPFQYTGRENDGTGLYYYRARYYDPTRQRFFSEDPIAFAGGDANFYAYVRGNPLGATDPFGLYLCRMDLPGLGEAYIDDSVAPLVADFIGRNYAAGISIVFNSAFRSTSEQAQLSWDASAITPTPPGGSLHEAGFAVDVSWRRVPVAQRSTVVANGNAAGLQWGGQFSHPDPVHFYMEVPGGQTQRASYIARAQKDASKSAQSPPPLCPHQ